MEIYERKNKKLEIIITRRHIERKGENTRKKERHEERRFSSVQSLDRLGHLREMRDDLAEILFQSFLQEALASSSGMDRDVHFFFFFF